MNKRHSTSRAPVLKVRYPSELPITAHAREIMRMIRRHQVVIIAGETGSGKTTQLPKMCLDAGFGDHGRIACTQPRRVAALAVSRRIAEELGVRWGADVGCQIRFRDHTSSETRIKIMTDGVLLAEISGDPDLRAYSAIIIDEAHERSLNIDFLLGYLNQLRRRRSDLRIIITSATIDTQVFSDAFGGAPVLEVSGRGFPIEVRHRPLDEILEQSGDFTYIDAAVKAVEEIISAEPPGDILVFMPSERDIRETMDLLSGRELGRVQLLALFGRLSNAEQQRVFSSTQARKVVIATNVAETSLTVPGIRYVVDTGLARISRYDARTRTQRLPVEPISQSSADQRMGRCGRIAPGVCIRLFSEADYASRPRFTQPEILRANLASVILRMQAFRIGDIDTFPFVDAPRQSTIRGGYELLHELGAFDRDRRLTNLGRRLAQLPVDPTVGRMLLQARKEDSLREILVIAAGLSAGDPRERPSDAAAAVDLIHRKFDHPDSDFLTFLNIWDAYHSQCDRMSQRQMRKFCKAHYLSYQRMREWRDIYEQLRMTLADLGELRENAIEAEYDQVHRALLTGLIGNVARRENTNVYIGVHDRRLTLFPGSSLYDAKGATKQKPSQDGGARKRQPQWIMASEWVETSRLFARTVARIDPTWILKLGEHICSSSVSDPFWDRDAGRVLGRLRISLYGLEIARRKVDYAKTDPHVATDLFVRCALVEGDVRENLAILERNQRVRKSFEEKQTRLRRSSLFGLDDTIFHFYRDRLEPGISSIHDLRRFVRERHGGRFDFLALSEEDLQATDGDSAIDLAAFPEGVTFNGKEARIEYAYRPGEESDGATLKIPLSALPGLQGEMLDWIVPGYLQERLEHMLRALPKHHRTRLAPITDTACRVLTALEPGKGSLMDQVRRIIRERFGVLLSTTDLCETAGPEHLRPRIQVMDSHNREIASGRSVEDLKQHYQHRLDQEIKRGGGLTRTAMWKAACARWEILELGEWSFPDPPEKIAVGDLNGIPVFAWHGLRRDGNAVSLALFTSVNTARSATDHGLPALAARSCGTAIGWFESDLRHALKRVQPAVVAFADPKVFVENAVGHAMDYLFAAEEAWIPLRKTVFEKVKARALTRINGFVVAFVEQLEQLCALRNELTVLGDVYPGMQRDIQGLLPGDFLTRIEYQRLAHVPRYLSAIRMRGQKYPNDPQRDAEKAARVRVWLDRWTSITREARKCTDPIPELAQMRWMIEELKVSIFAQQLGTAVPISDERLTAIESRLRERLTRNQCC